MEKTIYIVIRSRLKNILIHLAYGLFFEHNK